MSGFFLIDANGVRIPLTGSITAGRHIDNDIVLGGEDVRDFHFRMQVNDRQVRLILLPNAVVEVNGVAIDGETALIVDDRLTLGQETFRLHYMPDDDERMASWALRSFDDHVNQVIDAETVVGRDPSVDLVLSDTHVSRRHARLFVVDGILWVEDLKSANGTAINGQRIARGGRLFHGDEIGFDQMAFQVAAHGGDLTPLMQTGSMFRDATNRDLVLEEDEERDDMDTVEISSVDFPKVDQIAKTTEPGCFLTGLLDQRGRKEALQVGSYVVGRSADCDIVVDHPNVSERHAELSVTAEDCFISDLMSTNGLWVNGNAVQAAPLKDGDRVSFGSQQFVYQRLDAEPDPEPGERRRSLAIVTMALLLVVLVVYLVF